MKREEINISVNSLIPQAYGFSYAICSEEESAKQLLLDAYTLFIVQEHENLLGMKFDLKQRKDRKNYKRVIRLQLFQAIFELSLKRSQMIKIQTTNHLEFKDFFSLQLSQRALIYLKESQNFSIQDLQEVFTLQRHQVIEVLYNSKNILLADMDKLKISDSSSSLDRGRMNLISAFVNGTLKNKDLSSVEEIINENETTEEFYNQKLSERDFLQQLIPDREVSSNTLSSLRREFSLIDENVFPKEKLGFLKKTIKFLNEPIEIEI